MNFTVTSTTSAIVLNSHRHIILPSSITLASTDTPSQPWDIVQLDAITKDYDNAILTIPLTMPLPVGTSWTLSLQFTGYIFKEPYEGIFSNYNYYEFNDQKA